MYNRAAAGYVVRDIVEYTVMTLYTMDGRENIGDGSYDITAK